MSTTPEIAAAARSVVTTDLDALRRNVAHLSSMAPGAEYFAVVKADGYGHGAVPVAAAALEAGAAALCVASLAEARELRAHVADDVRIMVLFPLSDGEEADLEGFEVVISTPDGLRRLLDSDATCRVHVKVDTGMHRWGLSEEDAADAVRTLLDDHAGRLPLVGICSHLATADAPDPSFVEHQLERFRRFTERFPGIPRHLANSAATMRYPKTHFDAVRCGIAMYGGSPFDDEGISHGLAPVMTWTSTVQAVKHLRPGESAGYGRRFVAERDTTVALVPVGYADGYSRALSGLADVLIRGRRRRVVRPLSMDQLTAIVDEDVEVGDEVVLIGAQGDERVSIDELAHLAGSLPHEIACSVATSERRLTRRFDGPPMGNEPQEPPHDGRGAERGAI